MQINIKYFFMDILNNLSNSASLVIIMLELLFLLISILIIVAFYTLLERKVLAIIQRRKGPNVVGIWGLLQPLADGLKLLVKGLIIPSKADHIIFIIAPLISFAAALFQWIVLPLNNYLVVNNLNTAMIYTLAISSIAVYGLIMAGWSSNSKYSLLGALRSISQMISYELVLSFIMLGIILLVGSFDYLDIITHQRSVGYYFFLLPFFFIFIVVMLAETNRTPFDLSESESEVVSGYHTEYAGLSFALFFLGEYANMFFMSALITILFTGGFLSFNTINYLIFIVKVLIFVLIFVIIRGTAPRFRYDQLMMLGWKEFLPFVLGFFLFLIGWVILINSFFFNNVDFNNFSLFLSYGLLPFFYSTGLVNFSINDFNNLNQEEIEDYLYYIAFCYFNPEVPLIIRLCTQLGCCATYCFEVTGLTYEEFMENLKKPDTMTPEQILEYTLEMLAKQTEQDLKDKYDFFESLDDSYFKSPEEKQEMLELIKDNPDILILDDLALKILAENFLNILEECDFDSPEEKKELIDYIKANPNIVDKFSDSFSITKESLTFIFTSVLIRKFLIDIFTKIVNIFYNGSIISKFIDIKFFKIFHYNYLLFFFLFLFFKSVLNSWLDFIVFSQNIIQFYIKNINIKQLLFFFKFSTTLQINMLIDILAIDWLSTKNIYSEKSRFTIIYNFLSIFYNIRINLFCFTHEKILLNSIMALYFNANWAEREVWDLFGIFFKNHSNLRRILTDYGYKLYPLRKDHPLTGFLEVNYSDLSKSIELKKISFLQKYRDNTNVINPWKFSSFFIIFFENIMYPFLVYRKIDNSWELKKFFDKNQFYLKCYLRVQHKPYKLLQYLKIDCPFAVSFLYKCPINLLAKKNLSVGSKIFKNLSFTLSHSIYNLVFSFQLTFENFKLLLSVLYNTLVLLRIKPYFVELYPKVLVDLNRFRYLFSSSFFISYYSCYINIFTNLNYLIR